MVKPAVESLLDDFLISVFDVSTIAVFPCFRLLLQPCLETIVLANVGSDILLQLVKFVRVYATELDDVESVASSWDVEHLLVIKLAMNVELIYNRLQNVYRRDC